MKPLAVVILAAGKGTRMKSAIPKPLHTLCGRSMVGWLLDKAQGLEASKVLVVAGHELGRLKDHLDHRVQVVEQKKLLGSGHAVMQAARALKNFEGPVFVLYCDTPLISPEDLKKILENHRRHGTDCTLLSVVTSNPAGYGRIKKDSRGLVQKIVEDNDASPEEKAIGEVNVGCYVFSSKKLFDALKWVRQNPGKKEYYLTDVIEILAKDGKVRAFEVQDPVSVRGINTRADLAELQEIMQKDILSSWIEKGVILRDPKTTVIDAGAVIGRDTVIFPHTVIEEGCVIGENCQIGPFARLRGRSKIAAGAVIGNFVEIVRSEIGPKTQVKHLSYIGDAQIGAGVNVGAGTITANYDGKNKHKTIIKDGAQIGSGTVLVAPVTVGRLAKTGAGAVVTKKTSVPDKAVMVGVPAKLLKANQRKMK
jgi:bifunctional UDP-N-acetylglucosamine pyrophosphorylase/glucosamine-1-phosphate N-acetyltransferase